MFLEWTSATLQSRKEYIELQLEHLESPKHDVRRAAQGRLLYLLQGKETILYLVIDQRIDEFVSGTFAETTSPEMQLHWIIENAKAIRAVDGVTSLVVSVRDAAKRYNAAVLVYPILRNAQHTADVKKETARRINPFRHPRLLALDLNSVLWIRMMIDQQSSWIFWGCCTLLSRCSGRMKRLVIR